MMKDILNIYEREMIWYMVQIDKIYIDKNRIDELADAFRNSFNIERKISITDMIGLAGDLSSAVETVTSDATATADDILLGKTAYVKGRKISGTIATYDGENIGGEGSEDDEEEIEIVTPLFAPTITANNKTITITDNMNGAFADAYDLYMNGFLESSTTAKSIGVSEFLNGVKDTYTFNVKATGLLLDSPASNDVNYYKAFFMNYDDSLVHTQVELENYKFEYNGVIPKQNGLKFYGWNTDKNGTSRMDLNINQPTTYYAIYTSEMADLMVESKAKLFTPARYAGNGVIDDKAYIFGGANFTALKEWTTLDTIQCYDAENDSMTLLSVKLPIPLMFTKVAVVGKKAYIFSGATINSSDFEGSTANIATAYTNYRQDTIYCFDPSTNSITTMNSKVVADQVVEYNGLIYIFAHGELVKTYDVSKDRITELPALSTFGISYNKDYAVLGNKVYKFFDGSIVVYDLDNGNFENESVTFYKYGGCVASLGNKVYAFGGMFTQYLNPNKSIRSFDGQNMEIMNATLLKVGNTALVEGETFVIGGYIYVYGLWSQTVSQLSTDFILNYS